MDVSEIKFKGKLFRVGDRIKVPKYIPITDINRDNDSELHELKGEEVIIKSINKSDKEQHNEMSLQFNSKTYYWYALLDFINEEKTESKFNKSNKDLFGI